MTPPDFEAVTVVMQRYFDGLYHADSDVLRTVFHPDLTYVNATEDEYVSLDLESYMVRVDKRMPPVQSNDARADRIDAVTFRGDRMALVEARMMMFGRSFQDLLTLIRTDQDWRIIAKVFSHQDVED